MHYLLQNPYLYFWLKKQTCPIQIEHVTIVCVSDQSDSWDARNTHHVVPHIQKVDDHCSNLGKQILFGPAKPFKVEKGSPKIGDIMGGFPSTQTQQIIMFIEMTYKLFLFFFIYRSPSCRPLSFKTWKDVSKGDIRIFLAQLIAMGLVRKTSIESYWNHGEIVRTPYFGTYMSQNNFKIFCQIFIL